MSVHSGWKQRALVFSMKFSNANPFSSSIDERLTQPGAVDFLEDFFFLFLFVYLLILSKKVKAATTNMICHGNGTCKK